MKIFRQADMRVRTALMTALLGLILAAIAGGVSAAPEADDCVRSIAKIYESDSPAVITLVTRRVNPYRVRNRVQRGLGSAFLIDGKKGFAVTNAHVVYGAQSSWCPRPALG